MLIHCQDIQNVKKEIPSATLFAERTGVHIWEINTTDFSEEDFRSIVELLSEAELKRAEKFRFEKDKRTFVLGRGILRRLIARYLQISIGEIGLGTGPFGKLFLEGFEKQLQFNISHSGTRIVLAFRFQALAVGIDVERIQQSFDFHEIVSNFFTERERFQINSPAQFYRFWTRKEALLKTTGAGLVEAIRELDISRKKNTLKTCEKRLKPHLEKRFFLSSFHEGDYCFTLGLEGQKEDFRFMAGKKNLADLST